MHRDVCGNHSVPGTQRNNNTQPATQTARPKTTAVSTNTRVTSLLHVLGIADDVRPPPRLLW